MQRSNPASLWLIALAMHLVAHVPTLLGTTVVEPTFSEMAQDAEFIFEGKVNKTESMWRTVGTNSVIITAVEFSVLEVLKGQSEKVLRLEFLGGTIGGKTLTVAGVPQFQTGDHGILFVEKRTGQVSPIIGMYYGRFILRTDKVSGERVVCDYAGRHLVRGKAVPAGPVSASPAKAQSETQRVTDQEFKSAILAEIGVRKKR